MKRESRDISHYMLWSCDSYPMIVKREVTPKCSFNRTIMFNAHQNLIFLNFSSNIAYPGPHWNGGCNILGVINPAVLSLPS